MTPTLTRPINAAIPTKNPFYHFFLTTFPVLLYRQIDVQIFFHGIHPLLINFIIVLQTVSGMGQFKILVVNIVFF